MAIRYDKKLNQEINRIIKNFNQKISRLEKQERELLPSKISKKELKQDVYTRNELQRKLKELKRFSARGVEDVITTKGGIKLTKYQLNELKKENARVKRNITREIKRMETEKPKILGKEQSVTFSEMGDTVYLNLKARRKALNKDIEKLSKDQLQDFKTLLEKSKRKGSYYWDNLFKENWIDMLNKLGYHYDVDTEKLKKIHDRLINLSVNKFIKLFDNEKAIRSILDYYPIMTGRVKDMNPEDIRDDVENLYNALYKNLDIILRDYE